tara:strand:- start:3753 stop:4010 length:258 start_codon:yes stop_codon:yes gene_type:complete
MSGVTQSEENIKFITTTPNITSPMKIQNVESAAMCSVTSLRDLFHVNPDNNDGDDSEEEEVYGVELVQDPLSCSVGYNPEAHKDL